ncbi:acyl carrier protein [Streptomyces sp. NPDC006552]|uniref:acyl carrier protein n=1 Tax=Streptomyces sp. NPDC006552 TaxID=3157179 RepID=UPI0033B9C607
MKDGLAPTQSAVFDRVHTLLCDLLLWESLPADYDLGNSGVFNSAKFLELFVALETEFDISITGADIKQDTFRTLNSITRFVCAKQAVA